MQVMVCYDVSVNRRRTKLAKLMIRFLDRVQKSTFEGDLTAAQLETLRAESLKIIDAETDSVRVYHICTACRARTEIIGTGVYIEKEDDDVVV